MLTFTVEELIRFLSNWTMTFFEGAKRSGDIVFSRYYSFFKHPVLVREHQVESLYVMVQNRDSSDKTIRSHPFHDSQNGNLAASLWIAKLFTWPPNP